MSPDFKIPRFPNAAASTGAGRSLSQSDTNPTPFSRHLGITYRKGKHSCSAAAHLVFSLSLSLSLSQTTRWPRYQTVASFRYWPPLLLPAFSTLFCSACIPRLLVFNAPSFSLSSSAAQAFFSSSARIMGPWPVRENMRPGGERAPRFVRRLMAGRTSC